MNTPPPIHTVTLYPELVEALLTLLRGLSDEEWAQPTVCTGWSVKDVALHLLGGDIGLLSRVRDDFSPVGDEIASWEDLVALINELNAVWMRATRRMSPRLLCDLLEFTGRQVCDYVASLDPQRTGPPVGWAGPEPAPVWMMLAQEYTERWHHQQHIREAVGVPGLTEPQYLAPVLAAFVHALPRTYHAVDAHHGTTVTVHITGPAGGTWTIRREHDGWQLYTDADATPQAELTLPQDTAWRLFTNGISKEESAERATIAGDRALGTHVLEATAIIA